MDNSELRELLAAYVAHTRDTSGCSDHADAPHGFDRNGSHSADRYVCDCEGWGPDWADDIVCRAAVAEALPRLLAESDELARLRAEIAGARISTVQENRGYMKDCSHYAPAPKELDGTRVRLVPDQAAA